MATCKLLVPVFDVYRIRALNNADRSYGIWLGRSGYGDNVASGKEGWFVYLFRFVVLPPE
jgi:hypothetical protein